MASKVYPVHYSTRAKWQLGNSQHFRFTKIFYSNQSSVYVCQNRSIIVTIVYGSAIILEEKINYLLLSYNWYVHATKHNCCDNERDSNNQFSLALANNESHYIFIKDFLDTSLRRPYIFSTEQGPQRHQAAEQLNMKTILIKEKFYLLDSYQV